MRIRRAFTLIELLVVIAIIAVLVTMVVPFVSGAREAGRRTRCVAILRQMDYAVKDYALDNGGVLPWGYWSSHPSGTRTVFEAIGRNLFNDARAVTKAEEFSKDGRRHRMYCPSFLDRRLSNVNADSPYYTYSFLGDGSEVGIFPHLSVFNGPNTHLRRSRFTALAQLKSPGTIVEFFDSGGSWGTARHAWRFGFGGDAPQPNHRGMVNIIFMDGHVEPLHLQDARQLAATEHGWRSMLGR